MQLTKNLTLAELWMHDKAIPSPEQVRTNYVGALTILQPIRTEFGRPVIITDGYRTPEDNARVGGSKSTEHTFGAGKIGLEKYQGAWDINIDPKDDHGLRLRVYRFLMDRCRYSVGQVIWYLETTHLHVSIAGAVNQSEFLCCVSKKSADYRPVASVQDIVALDSRLKAVKV